MFGSRGRFDKDLSRDVHSAEDYYKRKVDELKRQRRVEKDARKEVKGIKKEEGLLKKAYARASPRVKALIKKIWQREEQNKRDEEEIASGNENPREEEQLTKADEEREEENERELDAAVREEMREGDRETAEELAEAEVQSKKNVRLEQEEEAMEEIEEADDKKAQTDVSEEVSDERDESQ